MNILEEIVEYKRGCLEVQKRQVSEESLLKELNKNPLSEPRFKYKISRAGIHLIAEVKKASPSIGVLKEDFNALAIACAFEQGGAVSLSVLTEDKYFKGSLSVLDEIRSKVSLPLLRKDFIIDKYQLYESKLHGADAILLIVSILTEEEIKQFLKAAKELKLDVVVEVHSRQELRKALDCGSEIVGINTRNLVDFSVDLNILTQLIKDIPEGYTVICESGIKNTSDLAIVKSCGVDAVLIGEILVKAQDAIVKTREFVDFLNSK